MKLSRKKRSAGRRARRREEASREHLPRRPDLEPAHDQPWVPTSGLTDRLRRSPRR